MNLLKKYGKQCMSCMSDSFYHLSTNGFVLLVDLIIKRKLNIINFQRKKINSINRFKYAEKQDIVHMYRSN